MKTSTAPTSGFTHWLATSRSGSGRVLLVIGLALAGLAVWLMYQSGAWAGGPTAAVSTDAPMLFSGLFSAVCALAFLCCGGWQFSSETYPNRNSLNARLIVLILTGVIGAGLFALGLALLYTWGETLTKLLREGEREGAWRVLLGLAAMLVGLMIMFGGLQSVRADEKQIIGIRRYVYGFNAFLTGFLLLAVLVVINVICYLKLPASIDATQTGSFTLSERSRQILSELDEPVTVYIVMLPERSVYADVRGLLTKAQEVNPKIHVETLSPRDIKGIGTLAKRFPRLTEEAEGLLVVVNDDPNKSSYIPARDLVQSDMNPMGGGDRSEKFVGESKLINEISFIRAGKTKPIVYVTQGYGEPDINDMSKRDGLGILKDRLQRRNFEVKPLKLDLLSPQVPDDANIVIVAGPKQTMPASIAGALKEYLEKGGKMIAMFDVVDVPKTEREMPLTGLEALMTLYSVDVTRERLFSIVPVGQQGGGIAATDQVLGDIDPKALNQPIMTPFKGVEFQFVSCRNIRALPDAGGGGGPRPQVLLVTSERIPVWTESNPNADLQQTLNLFVKDRAEAKKRLTSGLPLMITVSESQRGIPGHPPGPEKPKLVVFGDTTFVANLFAQDREAVEFDLFIGALEWLRERPANIGIEARPYQYYEMDRSVATFSDRLRYMPLLVASVAVLGLGIGVWLARRQ